MDSKNVQPRGEIHNHLIYKVALYALPYGYKGLLLQPLITYSTWPSLLFEVLSEIFTRNSVGSFDNIMQIAVFRVSEDCKRVANNTGRDLRCGDNALADQDSAFLSVTGMYIHRIHT